MTCMKMRVGGTLPVADCLRERPPSLGDCKMCAHTEALKKDFKLLESSAQEGGKGKTLVPKAIDADDEDDRRDSDDSDDDDDEAGPAYLNLNRTLSPLL